MVHNHTIWEQIYRELVSKCPKVEEDFGEWGKLKDRIDYLKKRYRECIKHNRRTGSDPKKSPYFEEMDAVLGCRPITDPGEDHMDNRSSEDERQSELVAPSTPSDYLEQGTTSSTTESLPDNQEDVAGPSTIPARCPQPSPGPDPTPSNGRRKRKGKKTQVMEAVEKGLDRIFQHEAASGGDYMRYERDRLEWEKEAERNRMDFERCRLDFEMRRMEAEERRSRENRELIMQLFQCLRPTAFPPTTPFNYSPYPSYLAPSEVQFGPSAPSATPVSHPKQQSHPPSLP